MVELSLEEFRELLHTKDTVVDRIPLSLKGNIEIHEKMDGYRIIAGYANVAVVDKQDQLIPIDTLRKGMESLLKDPHYANLMLVHKNIQVGKIIPSFKGYHTRVDDKGLFIVCEIRSDTEIANEVWNSILVGEYGAFSIGCEVILSHEECNTDKCITILDDINIFEVSICQNPVNQESGFVILSKSQYEEGLDSDVCVVCENKENIIADNMVKSKKDDEPKEEVEEEKAEEVIEQKDESDVYLQKLEEMERKINALEGLIQESLKAEEECEECTPEEKSEEEETEEKTEEESKDDEETEEKGAPWGSMDDKNQSSMPNPTLIDPTNYPNLGKAIEDLQKAVENLNSKLEVKSELDDLKLAIKARDDQIASLSKKVEVKEKSEDDAGVPQTVDSSEEEPVKLTDPNPIKVSKGKYGKQFFYEDY